MAFGSRKRGADSKESTACAGAMDSYGENIRKPKPCAIRKSKPCDVRRSKLATPRWFTLSCAPRWPAKRVRTVRVSAPRRGACRRCPTACMQSRPGNTFPYRCLCMITHAYIHTHTDQVVALAGRSLTRMKGGAWNSQPSSRPARHGVVRLGAWAFRRDPRIPFNKP